jgi:hypothetical protein
MSVSAGAGDREPRIRSPTNEEKKNPIHHLHDITITTRTVPAITRPDVDPSRTHGTPQIKAESNPRHRIDGSDPLLIVRCRQRHVIAFIARLNNYGSHTQGDRSTWTLGLDDRWATWTLSIGLRTVGTRSWAIM